MKIDINEILMVTGGDLLSGEIRTSVENISINSRRINPGDLFIAVKGDSFDGHDFLEDASCRGAIGFIVKKDPGVPCAFGSKPVVAVNDTVEAMADIASFLRSKVDIPVICVTGTNGKTTVKDLLAGILSSRFNVLKSQRSYNNTIGLSLTLFDLQDDHDASVLEIGTNHPGEIEELARLGSPGRVIITNVGEGHLEAFLDKQGVLREKIMILEGLSAGGKGFVNGDDTLLYEELKGRDGIVFYGESERCDIRISDIARADNGYDFTLGGRSYHIPLEGRHNVHNAAAAAAVAEDMGLSPEEVAESLSCLSLPGMRLERQVVGGITFINDSYNANPSSFKCALDVLEGSGDSGIRGVVAGDMLELGERAKELHELLGFDIGGRNIDFLVVMGEFAEDTAKGASAGGMNSDHIFLAASHGNAADLLSKMPGEKKTVLLKGSRNLKMEEVLKCFTTSCIL